MAAKIDTCYEHITEGPTNQYHTLTYIETIVFGQVLFLEHYNGENIKVLYIASADYDMFNTMYKEIGIEKFGKVRALK